MATAQDDVASETALIALASRLQVVCLEQALTVSLAESCTGGLIGHVLTEVPGSSGYFVGGTMAYSDEVKERELGVTADVLSAHGAVSAQTARAMALGLRKRFRVNLAGAVTGIAGPAGGTPSKPVGLTYIAVADEGGVEIRRYVWPFERSANKRASAEALVLLLIERAEGRAERASSMGEGAPARFAGSASESGDPAAGRAGSASR